MHSVLFFFFSFSSFFKVIHDRALKRIRHLVVHASNEVILNHGLQVLPQILSFYCLPQTAGICTTGSQWGNKQLAFSLQNTRQRLQNNYKSCFQTADVLLCIFPATCTPKNKKNTSNNPTPSKTNRHKLMSLLRGATAVSQHSFPQVLPILAALHWPELGCSGHYL